MKKDEYDRYVKFFREVGPILKEGPGRDRENREKVAELLLFESANTPAGKYLTLAEYVAAMPQEQKEIYYLIGESRELLEHSPYLEGARAQGQDVLLLTDPVDEFMVPALGEYRGKRLVAVDRADLGGAKGKKPEGQEKFQKLFDFLKGKLPEVGEVRLSTRLRESAACLVAAEGAASAHLERLMQRLGRDDFGLAKRILELNGEHPAVLA